jgi:Ca2+-binding RTX toxin-like protein
VGGTGLALDADRRLSGGTVEQITMFGPDGQKWAEWICLEPGGLNLSVTALKAALSDPYKLDALLSSWTYSYSNEGTTDHYGYPMTFEGGRNADTLKGSTGIDTLFGAGGNDTICGNAGDDTIWGDGTKFAPMPAVHGHDWIDGGAGNDWISGSGGNDTILGGAGDDTLHGDTWDEVGHDTVRGGDGDDRIVGGRGDDKLFGDAGVDTLVARDFSDDGSTWVVNLGAGTSTGQGTDTISGFENVTGSLYAKNNITGDAGANRIFAGQNADVLNGAGGNDRLDGYKGGDTIQGGAGNDLLYGGEGKDTLWGGTGLDAFVFHHTGNANADRVEDFSSADDNIYLAGNLLDWDSGFWGQGPVATNLFKDLTRDAQDADDKVLYNRKTGELWLDRDGLGGAGPELICQLDPGTRISFADIHLRWDM